MGHFTERFKMRLFNPAKIRLIAITVGAAVGIGLLFQNCADPLNLAKDNSSLSEGLPFAFDTSVDTMAYMSCAGGSTASNPEAIFTFRVGGYVANSGVRFTAPYFTATGSFNPEQRAAALNQSEQNKNAVLQLAIRQVINYNSLLTATGSTPQFGRDFGNALGPLDEMGIATPLAQQPSSNPSRLSYFPGTGKYLEGSVRFIGDEGQASLVRGTLGGRQGILALTYSKGPSDFTARTPDTSRPDRAYGTGYVLSFSDPGLGDADPEARVLGSVEEFNLATGQAGADNKPWTCPPELRYWVARSCSECGCTTDPQGNATYQTLRRVLRHEHWFIDSANRCIAQKAVNHCYSASPTVYHWVSVCVRQQ